MAAFEAAPNYQASGSTGALWLVHKFIMFTNYEQFIYMNNILTMFNIIKK